jgi:hypothetical protein
MTTEPTSPVQEETRRREPSRSAGSSRRIWLVVGIVVVVAVVTWLIVRGGDDNDKAAQGPEVKTGVPTLLSEADLREYGRLQAMPVYWAGPQPNRKYEVTHTRDGKYYVRYLTPSAQAGDGHPRYLTVGTYPGSNAYGALRAIGARKGTSEINTRSGALVVIDKKKPTSVYFAFPNRQFQVEVFDPRASRARRVVLGGQVQRVR